MLLSHFFDTLKILPCTIFNYTPQGLQFMNSVTAILNNTQPQLFGIWGCAQYLEMDRQEEQQTLTCSCNIIKQGLWGEAIQEESGLRGGHRRSRGRGWAAWKEGTATLWGFWSFFFFFFTHRNKSLLNKSRHKGGHITWWQQHGFTARTCLSLMEDFKIENLTT